MTGNVGAMFSRTEVLGGMPARRAASAVFAIENRTARLVVRSRRAVERYVSERAAAHEEQAFLQALAEGREPPLRPSIQDLERHAPDWSNLVPSDPSLRATVAHQLAAKYRFTRDRVPQLRTALRLDEPAVLESHGRLFGQPLDTIYADRLPAHDRWRWFRAGVAERLESLPPTWSAFALTLTETVGAGVLALPIALAGIGVLPAVALLVVFGLINLITIAALVESINRDGAIRYGTAYFGRLVEDYLGVPGRVVLSVAVFAVNALAVASYIIGFGSTLGGSTGTTPLIWVGLLFAATIVVLRRESLDATVATAILIGLTNIALLLGIGSLGILHADPGRLTALPVINAAAVPLVFGVLLTAYFGHTSAGTAAKLVLARDPSGRALLRGNLAAMTVAMALYGFVVLGVNGAVPAKALVGFSGTSVEPLTRVAGPSVGLLGAAFVVLAMGLATAISSLALYNQAREITPNLLERMGRWKPGTSDRSFAAVPVFAIFLVVIGMLVSGQASFSGPIALIGTLAVPILGGVFPMLMVLAARRRGEYVPSDAPRWLGHPVTVLGVAALFGVGVLVQGIFIWHEPIGQLTAVLVALLMLGISVYAMRRGAFVPRTVLEIRWGRRGDRPRFSLVSAGREAATSVRLLTSGNTSDVHGSSGLLDAEDFEAATFTVPGPREVTIWSHRVDDEGASIAVPVAVSAAATHPGSPGSPGSSPTRELGTTDSDGRLSVTLIAGAIEITIRNPNGDTHTRRAGLATKANPAASTVQLAASGKVAS
jgi:amino acid permease